jgi:hypothetical protein
VLLFLLIVAYNSFVLISRLAAEAPNFYLNTAVTIQLFLFLLLAFYNPSLIPLFLVAGSISVFFARWCMVHYGQEE